MFSVTIGKGDTVDVRKGPFTAATLAWMALVDLLEEGQDDTVETFVLEGDRTPEEAAQQNDAYKAYQAAIDAALLNEWFDPGSVTVDLDGGITFSVVES